MPPKCETLGSWGVWWLGLVRVPNTEDEKNLSKDAIAKANKVV